MRDEKMTLLNQGSVDTDHASLHAFIRQWTTVWFGSRACWAAISWQPNWRNLEDLPDYKFNGFETCRYSPSFFSHMGYYENGWYSMAILGYWRLNHDATVHTDQMFAPLRKWRGDKKISSSGMSSARTAPQNPVFISRSRNDDLRWKMLLIASHNSTQILPKWHFHLLPRNLTWNLKNDSLLKGI